MIFDEILEDTPLVLDDVFGIDSCKTQIKMYVDYLKFPKKKRFANYNIVIESKISETEYTKEKLLLYLTSKLKESRIIKTNAYYMTDEDVSALTNNEDLTFSEDLIVIDFEKSDFDGLAYSKEVNEYVKNNPQKVFIIIEKVHYKLPICTELKETFDWLFIIREITERNKANYFKSQFKKCGITVNDTVDLTYYIQDRDLEDIKYDSVQLAYYCKKKNIEEINFENVERIFDSLSCDSNNKNNSASFDNMIGLKETKEKMIKIINYIKKSKQKNGNTPMLHMCFTRKSRHGKDLFCTYFGADF